MGQVTARTSSRGFQGGHEWFEIVQETMLRKKRTWFDRGLLRTSSDGAVLGRSDRYASTVLDSVLEPDELGQKLVVGCRRETEAGGS